MHFSVINLLVTATLFLAAYAHVDQQQKDQLKNLMGDKDAMAKYMEENGDKMKDIMGDEDAMKKMMEGDEMKNMMESDEMKEMMEDEEMKKLFADMGAMGKDGAGGDANPDAMAGMMEMLEKMMGGEGKEETGELGENDEEDQVELGEKDEEDL
jgi:hypothetical protein